MSAAAAFPELDFQGVAGAAGVDFNLAPEAAIAYFRARGLRPTFAWQDMLREEHTRAFTVAKMLDMDLLTTVQQAVDVAIAEGTDIRAFREQLIPILQSAGWWGRQTMVDPLTGQPREVQLGSAYRLETIFRTNLQNAYAVGAWNAIEEQRDAAPYLLYDAVDDDRTRPEHARLDGLVLEVGSRFWDTHAPPNGWNCRCGLLQLDQAQLEALGKTGPDRAPRIRRRRWTNPRTGETELIPVDLDPGWDYNPGRAATIGVQNIMAEKIAALPREFALAAFGWAVQAAAAGEYPSELVETLAAELGVELPEGE